VRIFRHLIIATGGVEFHGYTPKEIYVMGSLVLDILDKVPKAEGTSAIGFQHVDPVGVSLMDDDEEEEDKSIGYKPKKGE
jgi:hypothetical protein